MKYPGRIGSAAVLAATALAAITVLAGPASAATRHDAGFGRAVAGTVTPKRISATQLMSLFCRYWSSGSAKLSTR